MRSNTNDSFVRLFMDGQSAWNVSLNVVYYPARRSRRSLASPYRPLFDVADNGSMIRTIGR